MRDVAVLGVGMHRFGAYYGEKPNTELALSAGMAEAFNLPDRYRLSTQSNSSILFDGPGGLFTLSRTQDLSFFLGSLFADFTDGNFRTPFVFPQGFGSNATGFLEISELATAFGSPITHGIAYAALDVSSFTFEAAPAPPVPAGVPEPATWAMFILGLAAVGAMLRARQAPRAAFSPPSALGRAAAASPIADLRSAY